MLSFLGSAFAIIANLTGGALKWIGLYGGEKQTEARTINDDQKKIDEFNRLQANGDLGGIQRGLSDTLPDK